MTDIWSYLARDPLFWLSATVLAYAFGLALFHFGRAAPLLNPTLMASLLISGLLYLTSTPFETYFEGAQFVHFLLGPATICLALPLYDNLGRMRETALPLILALVAGSVTAILSALLIASAFDIPLPILASLAPKSATAAVAMGISDATGGSPTLTTLFVMMAGVSGAVLTTPLLNALRVKDWRARGFAIGLASHGLGTARALQVHPTAGAFAGLAMGLNALMTAILAPILLSLFR